LQEELLPEQLDLDEGAIYDSSLKAFFWGCKSIENRRYDCSKRSNKGRGRWKNENIYIYIFSSPTMTNTSHPPGRESQGLLICDLQNIKSPAIPTSLCGESLGRALMLKENIR
jgi:hypothetical protein